MDNPQTPATLLPGDFEAIEAAVMETEKGRWFLAEYARRNRVSDTAAVLDAVAGLERMLRRERRPDIDRIRLDVAEMRDAIERTKSEIAQLKHDSGEVSRVERATSELDSIVTQTEAATTEILGAAEKLQEIAFVLRDARVEAEACDAIDQLIMQIYTACSFQDLTGQRTQKVVHVLRFLESRINSMIEIWGLDDEQPDRESAMPVRVDERPDAHLLNGPALDGEGIDQSRIDDLMSGSAVAGSDPFDFDLGDEEGSFAPSAASEQASLFDNDFSAATESALTRVPSPDHDDIMALDRVVAEDLGSDWVTEFGDEALAAQLAAEMSAADTDHDLTPDRADQAVSSVLAEANAAMDEAIETLRDVTGAVTGNPAAGRPAVEEDPLARLGRAERQALFS
jgi:hypothetical protein